MLDIISVESQEQVRHVKLLLQEYIAWDTEVTAKLGFDANTLLTFYYQPTNESLGDFTPPYGCLLMANYEGKVAGCGALRRLNPSTGEIKQMYVRPAFRGQGIGRGLMAALIQEARRIGYIQLRLETARFMREAQALYIALGFKEITPYYAIPDALKPITLFMELSLK